MRTDIEVSRSSLYSFNDKTLSCFPPPPKQRMQSVVHLQPVKLLEFGGGGFRGAGSGRILLERGKCRFCDIAFVNKYLNCM